MADMLRGVAQMVRDALLPSDTNPEKKGEELSEFVKDISEAAPTEQQDTQQADQAASKSALGDKVEKLSSTIEKNLGKSHDINVPSHERCEASTDLGAPEPDTQDAQVYDTGVSQGVQPEKATSGNPVSSRKEGFEARTYQMAAGAETPDGQLQKLHLHDQKGEEYEGAPLAGRSEPFDAPAHGAGASTSEQDRPVKLTMGHDYRHETREQQQQETGGETTTTSIEGADASRVSMDTGGEPSEGMKGETAPVSGSGAEDESRMSMEGGGQMATSTATEGTETSPATEATDMGGDAAAGMSPHMKDFEADINAEAKGAETPDGPLERLHLHADHGSEGAGSKADQQLQHVLEEGLPTPPPGSGAPTSQQDPPDKMMTHRKEESGVAGRAGATESGSLTGPAEPGAEQTLKEVDTAGETTSAGAAAAADSSAAWSTATVMASATEGGMSLDGDAAAGAVPHKKNFEAETNSEAKGAETPDGPLEKLHLHADHGSEGAGSKADQQLQKVLQEGAPTPPPGYGATTSEQDPPDKMFPHHREEAGVAGRTASSTETATAASTRKSEGHKREGSEVVDDGRVIKSEGLAKLAEAVADVEGTAPEKVVHKPVEKSEEAAKSEKMLKEGHEHPYVPQPDEKEDMPEALQQPGHQGGDAPSSVTGAGARQAALGPGPYEHASDVEMQGQRPAGASEPAGAHAYPDTGRTPTSDMTAKEGVAGGYDAPGKGGSATVEAAHQSYIDNPESASLPAHKTRLPINVKQSGDEGVQYTGKPGERPKTTGGGVEFELGTITDAAIDTSGPKDYPENMAA